MNQWTLNDSPDDTLDELKLYLPSIEQQLRKQIEPKLEQQFQQIIEEQLSKIQKQAEGQFQQAMEALQSQMTLLKQQKFNQLQEQLNHLKAQKEEREKVRLVHAQQKFVLEHFDDRVLVHPLMKQLEHNLQSQIRDQMTLKYQVIKQKRVKQLKLRLQNRQRKDRIQTDKNIQKQIYSNSGLEQIKADISKFKVSLASLKSKYNLKISKITTEIKDLQKKCQEVQFINSDQIIQQLQIEIEQLKVQIQSNQIQQRQANFQENSSQYFNQRANNFSLGANNANDKISHQNEEVGNRYMQGVQYINEDIDIDSEDSLDQMTSTQRNEHQQIPLPPNTRALTLKRLLVQQHSQKSQYQNTTNQLYIDKPISCLLNFNVAKMLREQWYEDSFDRYISLRNSKQNQFNSQNQHPQNNFQSLYEQHLKKLNRDSKVPKKKKLTEKAKQQISLNFSSQRHKNSQTYF